MANASHALAYLLTQVLPELVEMCRSHDYTDMVVVHEHRGEPDGLVVCHLPYGPTAFFGLYNTVRRCHQSCDGDFPSHPTGQDGSRCPPGGTLSLFAAEGARICWLPGHCALLYSQAQ